MMTFNKCLIYNWNIVWNCMDDKTLSQLDVCINAAKHKFLKLFFGHLFTELLHKDNSSLITIKCKGFRWHYRFQSWYYKVKGISKHHHAHSNTEETHNDLTGHFSCCLAWSSLSGNKIGMNTTTTGLDFLLSYLLFLVSLEIKFKICLDTIWRLDWTLIAIFALFNPDPLEQNYGNIITSYLDPFTQK